MTELGTTFAGRIALVTGAGSPIGIGFATARLLGRGGARVAIASNTDRIYRPSPSWNARASRQVVTSGTS